MNIKTSVVITTINEPTDAVLALAAGCCRRGCDFIAIGDAKGPANFVVEGATFYGLVAQRALPFRFAAICPTKHYARKNIGYLLAVQSGSDRILETDDDNIPGDGFWDIRPASQNLPINDHAGWVNVYRYFTKEHIWPRGLHLSEVRQAPKEFDSLPIQNVHCPIQQGLANANPDVDAIYRLTMPLPLDFRSGLSVALGAGAWCPFNSQNTAWWREAFPLLYLPYHCSFRMTDIWRSFVAQRIAWTNGWSLMFYEPTVHQERNEHDLMRDFEEEIPGYLNNGKIAIALGALKLNSGVDEIPNNMRTCYSELIRIGVVGPEELNLLNAWLDDLAELGR